MLVDVSLAYVLGFSLLFLASQIRPKCKDVADEGKLFGVQQVNGDLSDLLNVLANVFVANLWNFNHSLQRFFRNVFVLHRSSSANSTHDKVSLLFVLEVVRCRWDDPL